MILSPKETKKIYGPKKAKRPSPQATFARHLAKESYDFP